MASLGRVLFLAHLPLTLLVIWWAWLGRSMFAEPGWWLLMMPIFFGGPILIGFAISETLVFLRRERPLTFTGTESFVVLGNWLGWIGLGFFLVDFGGRRDDAGSVFATVAGEDWLDLSTDLAIASGVVIVVTWVALVGLLAVDLVRKRPAADAEPERVSTDA